MSPIRVGLPRRRKMLVYVVSLFVGTINLFLVILKKYITFTPNKSTSLRDWSRAYGCSLGGIFIL